MTDPDKPAEPGQPRPEHSQSPTGHSQPPSAPQPGDGYPAPPAQPYGGGYPPQSGGYPPQSGGYPPQSGGYPPYGGFPAPPTGPKNGLGIAALVLAIVGLVFVWSVIGGVIAGAVAVILGFLGWGRAKRGEATNGGLAIAGIVLGFLAIVAGLAFIAIYWAVFRDVGGQDFLDCLREAGNDQAAQQDCADQFQRSIEDQFDVELTPTPTR